MISLASHKKYVWKIRRICTLISIHSFLSTHQCEGVEKSCNDSVVRGRPSLGFLWPNSIPVVKLSRCAPIPLGEINEEKPFNDSAVDLSSVSSPNSITLVKHPPSTPSPGGAQWIQINLVQFQFNLVDDNRWSNWPQLNYTKPQRQRSTKWCQDFRWFYFKQMKMIHAHLFLVNLTKSNFISKNKTRQQVGCSRWDNVTWKW